MKNVEIEYKVMVSKENFYKLEGILDKTYSPAYYNQTNFYYDDNRKLYENKLSLRIRYIENQNMYISTLKIKNNDERIEIESILKEKDITLVDIETKDLLGKHNIDVNSLKEIAFLKTIRKEYKIDDTLLCLDYNQFYQNEDYEIECEADSMEKAKRTIDTILKLYNIEYKQSTMSKMARAINNRK